MHSFKSKKLESPNFFYNHHFNLVDLFNKKYHEDESKDKMNDWESRFFWDIIRMAVINVWSLIQEFQKTSLFELFDFLGEWLLKESSMKRRLLSTKK